MVNDELNLINLCRYIHLNPVAAKISKTASQYPWSSHRYYLFSNAPKWIDLSITETAIRKITNYTYREFIHIEPNREKWLPAFYFNEHGNFIIDDSTAPENQPAYANLSFTSKSQLSLENAVEIIAHLLGTNIYELKNLSRARDLSRKRAMVVFFILKRSIATVTEISYFFNRSATAMQKQYMKVKNNTWAFIDKSMYQHICEALEKKWP